VDIRKWEDSNVYKLIEKQFPKVKADKMLADLWCIALEWAKNYVRQRQTFKMNTKGENMPSLSRATQRASTTTSPSSFATPR
jgi:hypothetical protein